MLDGIIIETMRERERPFEPVPLELPMPELPPETHDGPQGDDENPERGVVIIEPDGTERKDGLGYLRGGAYLSQ